MADYISRKDAIDWFMSFIMMGEDNIPAETAVDDLKWAIPAADVEPVRHGRWERTDDDWNSLSTFQCSSCGEEWCFEIDEDLLSLNYNYCPNCGAKMDLEDKANDN